MTALGETYFQELIRCLECRLLALSLPSPWLVQRLFHLPVCLDEGEEAPSSSWA